MGKRATEDGRPYEMPTANLTTTASI